MFLKSVLIRFYKSFNYDYLRKSDSKVKTHHSWETFDEMWYPYVTIPIEHDVTAVVGENESGKSHLLHAIEQGISGQGITREDVCRYSIFFRVEAGKMHWPDFGFEWGLTNDDDREVLKAAGIKESVSDIKSFFLFRNSKNKLFAYLARDSKPIKVKSNFIDSLPSVFRLKENVGLPRSVPISYLSPKNSTQTAIALLDRRRRSDFFNKICDSPNLFDSQDTIVQKASEIAAIFQGPTGPTSASFGESQEEELKLARDLIFKIAKVGPEAIEVLKCSLENGNDAFANSIIAEINDALARNLNFPQWWVQDSEFRLEVSPRDYDLVFTVRDRTGREYSFDERSSGLKYFLSYYIQYLAHEPSKKDGRAEILLMDEPDAFLSSQGQQDLLKVFDAFAYPVNGNPVQVVYVTHSPFLIDKNHAQRIRVLEKGVGDEGTRVVRDVSRNHYEPLRSAFGSFVGETTFMGNCNLITEGPSDQILLAGAARHLRSVVPQGWRL